MNRNYLIAGGAAIAIYFLFFRKKKDSVPKKKQQGGGGGGGGFFPTGVPASDKDETPDEGGTKVVSTGTGTQVIKGESDVVIQGNRPSPNTGGIPDVSVRPNTNKTNTRVSGGDVVSTGTQTQVVKGKKSTTSTQAGGGRGIGTGGVAGARTGLGEGTSTGQNKNVDPTRGRKDRQSGFLGIDAKFADFAGDVTPKFEFN